MLTLDEVKKLGSLARIELSSEELEQMQKDLSAILDYVEELKSVDVSGLEVLSQVTGLVNVQRQDEPKLCDFRDDIFANAPEMKDGYYKVKAIL
ncbi:MAG TPA: Asp-tRNA(Asn)/Glu-tRNA(Gln) amidotransferase subunit GatC [Patescibacteria group bacterium]|nr:Asp-tRNA(Asn)/Glu-tRNA(Gln) amidotransferase subunit GatC [Patescibacteria group bacterium]